MFRTMKSCADLRKDFEILEYFKNQKMGKSSILLPIFIISFFLIKLLDLASIAIKIIKK